MNRILIIDDNKDILLSLKILLKQYDFEVDTDENPKNIPLLLKKKSYNLILLDMNFKKGLIYGEEGLEWLKNIKKIDPDIIIILITAYGDIELAVKAMKFGASDFIQKPWDNQKLISTLSIALNLNKEKNKSNILKAQNLYLQNRYKEIIGESDEIKEVFSIIDKVSKTDVNVLITGENGTGKELVARAIHNSSLKHNDVLISVDMGAIPSTLFESELFGYEKGAFTGADKRKIGYIEAADRGTLFLDEIGNLPLIVQPKLLRVLDSRKVTPLGSEKSKEFDIRLICATNSKLKDLVKDNKFRQDLLYRINTVEIKLPALRERISDIPLLIDHFLKVYSKKYNKGNLRISSNAINRLKKYSWPGNVRELKHLVERAVILSNDNTLALSDFDIKEHFSQVFTNYSLEDNEKKIIFEVLEKEDKNLTKAARILGITRSTLYRKIEKYDL